jgi:circadian clock protein KaiC
MLIRAIDLFKAHGITSVFNSLTSSDHAVETTTMEICSLVDIWLLLRNLESVGERTRGLYVCKARGTSHSNQIREFLLTDKGVKLVDVMLDDAGQILTGSARMLHREMNQREITARDLDKNRRRALLDNRHQVLDAKIAALRAEYDEELSALDIELEGERAGL